MVPELLVDSRLRRSKVSTMRKPRLSLLLSIVIMLAATATSMTGCGKKGPLYLPDATQQQSDGEQSDKKSKKQKQ